ncbi:HEPN domain-containing protein [Occallatibacter riparius]|uniref:MAE_28990/MAE_18760 family HEPN-like nuclease n=1 Tax=Occallatibacter riparius TaxID=1002689 RepID=A0A9J7BRQ7_9BACT|nr:MAE_28990/MAE_18760 family HEPN-like nuclease [Occallatibacter riparius]UWZ85265.1 MAE_28990/MAE_18760 family HEPN-like nuclease [Occallatibacter riparius]
MWSCNGTLRDGLALLRHYLDGLDQQDKLLDLQSESCGDAGPVLKTIQEHFRARNNKARYEYNTVIVSLYGYLERFIEELIGEYLRGVSSNVATFAELPPIVQTNHLPLSLELARKVDYQRYAGMVRVEDVVARLHMCFSSPDKYQLNVEAFSQHTANFRHGIVTATFAQSGVSELGPALRRADAFKNFLATENPERDLDTYLAGNDEIVFARLDDLANRRNDVAHGTPTDDYLSHDLLRELIDFVDAYTTSLGEIIYERALPFMARRASPLGAAITVIDHRIVCVNLPAGKVSVGDILIAKTQDGSRPFKGGPIKEIQRDHVPTHSIDGGPGVQIGILVDFGAKDNHEFYVFNIV